MQIDPSFVKAERDKRAWSQEQLAAVAGVGLRTIQRVESTGIAANETAKSLAAVFECSVSDLRSPAVKSLSSFWKRPLFVGVTAMCSILCIAMIATQAQAKEIMLNVVFKTPQNDSKTFRMLTPAGKSTEALLDKRAKLVFVPTVEDHGLILITVDIYEYDGTDFRLISQPKVLTKNGKEAHIQQGSEGGKIYDIKIIPEMSR